MRRGVSLTVGLIVVVAGAGSIGAYSAGLIGTPPAEATATESVPRTTRAVARQTLELIEELDGTLGFEGSGSIVNQLSGTITRLPEVGAILERGDAILEVDGGLTSYLLYGSRPAWRTLDIDVDRGPDVKQLEENLVALGYLDDGHTPNRKFDEETEDAVLAWQADRGVEEDGIVRLGEVLFLPEPVRITSVQGQLGTRIGAGQTVATYSSTDRVITVFLAANRQDIVAVGDPVTVEFPDDTEGPGSIAEIASVATPATAQGGSAQVAVTIRLDDPATSGSQDGAPVTVRIVRDRREDVLTVPVSALLALAEGGYAVEVVDGNGAAHLVGVTPGLFSGTVVQVEAAGLDAGDLVVVPG